MMTEGLSRSHAVELFRKAGLPRRTPPEPESGTASLAGLDPGDAPRIVAPLAGRVYQAGSSGVFLNARAASGVSRLYWFCGEAFSGAGAPGEPLPWKPVPGNHQLRVIDDHGRSAESEVRVAEERGS